MRYTYRYWKERGRLFPRAKTCVTNIIVLFFRSANPVKRVKFLLASLLTNQIVNNHGRESFRKFYVFFFLILFKRSIADETY